MTSFAACVVAGLRAGLAAGLGLAAARLLRGTLGRPDTASLGPLRGHTIRRLAWALLLLPLLTPALPVGYAYANFALSLVHHPALNELLYFMVVALRLAPAAALVVLLAPAPAMSPEAVRCRILLAGPRPTLADRFAIALAWARGPGRSSLAAAGLVFLLAFQEFEIASLLGIDSWTIRVFDAQGKGLPLGESIVAALPAIALQAAALLPVMLLLTGGVDSRPGERLGPRPRGWAVLGSWVYLLAAAGVVTVVPAFILLRSALPGFRSISENFAFAGELRASFLFAFAAAVGAMLLASWAARAAGFVSRTRKRRDGGLSVNGSAGDHERSADNGDAGSMDGRGRSTKPVRAVDWETPVPSLALPANNAPRRRRFAARRWIPAAMLAPGLMGPLVVALAVQALFQLPALSRAYDTSPAGPSRTVEHQFQLPALSRMYDTPVPLLLALVAILLAPAVLIALMLNPGRDAQGVHAAAMLLRSADPGPRSAARRLLWDVAVRPRLWACFLLFCWSFFELTAASLLAPSDLRPASVMLYNLMHYGRNAVLSAMVCIAAAVPVMLLTLLATGRWWGAWMIRPRA
ncbi:MAG: hypothetical protein NTW19_23885 [Planctomycetota bacterium]|nr:hypothetical protein [Planctomycetota bacterium]